MARRKRKLNKEDDFASSSGGLAGNAQGGSHGDDRASSEDPTDDRPGSDDDNDDRAHS